MGPWFESFGAVKASPLAAFKLLKGREKVRWGAVPYGAVQQQC